MCCSDVKGTSAQKEFDIPVLQNVFGNLDGKEILCLGFSRGASQLAIYWSKDPSMNLVPLLKLHERENLKVKVIEGEDHLFSKKWESIYEEVLKSSFYPL